MLWKAINILKNIFIFGGMAVFLLIFAATCAVFIEHAEDELQRSCDVKELNALRVHGKEAIRKDDEACIDYKDRLKELDHREIKGILDIERKKLLDAP